MSDAGCGGGASDGLVVGDGGASDVVRGGGSSSSRTQSIARKKNYVSAYKRAERNYNRIQAERRAEAEARRAEKERREAAVQNYISLRRKMNNVIQKSTRKGQPRLNAQIEVLLEKIQRRESPAMKRSVPKK